MNCEILKTLYVKANGVIPCNDDAGEALCLGKVGNDWSPTKFFSTTIEKIRSEFLQGKVPWPGICENCAFLLAEDPKVDDGDSRIIEKFQVEPALACNLKCPACCNQEQIQYAKKPRVMSLETYSLALKALSTEGYQILEIEYCGQGEPLLNRQFSDFVDISRQLFPHAKQRLITNGNADYSEALGGEYIDQIIVSCDGFYQKNYEKSRVGGDIARVLKFILDACSEDEKVRPEVIWKYILFEFNDSDDELNAAQNMANEVGVDTLIFVYMNEH